MEAAGVKRMDATKGYEARRGWVNTPPARSLDAPGIVVTRSFVNPTPRETASVQHTIAGHSNRWRLPIVLGLCALSGCAGNMANRPCAQAAMSAPASSSMTRAADPTTTDPDKYKAVMENERVRVLRYHDQPGAKTRSHHHPDSMLYALSAFRRRLTFPDGTVSEREFKPGDVMWVPEQTHTGENIGTTDTEVLLVEVKGK
jgi:beta-alanine degradation protein BauB